jgi:hypothetical protein
MAKDVLKISFDARTGIKELERDLLGSMDQISDELSNKLEDAFEQAGRNPKLKKQLTGIYQGLFDDLAIASGDFDKINDAIDRFTGKIKYLNDVINTTKSKGKLNQGLLDNLSIENIDKVLKDYEKYAEKKKEIDNYQSKEFRNDKRSKTTIKSLKELERTYGDVGEAKEKYEEKVNNYLKNEKVETSTISKEIKEYSSLIALFDKVSNTKVDKGSDEAIKKSQSLLYIMQKISDLENGNTLFENFRTKELDINGITSSLTTLTKQVEASITDLVGKTTKELNKEIKEMLEKSVLEAEKASRKQFMAAQKTQEKIPNRNNQGLEKGTKNSSKDIDNLEQNYDEHNNIYAKYFDTANKSAEELEDTFYDIGDRLESLNQKNIDGDLVGEGLKEYVALYKQLEDLTTKIDGYSIPKQYTEQFDYLIKDNKELAEYANQLDEIKKKGYIQKGVNSGSDSAGNTENIDTSNVEELKKEVTEVKEDISAISSVKVDVDVQEALTNIDTIQEKLDKLPKTKNIEVHILDNDYSNTPLLSDDEGKTVTAFRGVKNAWSGLINEKGISFFTDKLGLAADYADSLAENGKVYAANLSFKNPLEIDGNGAKWNEIEYDGIKRTTDEIVEIAKQLGHDGVIFRNIRDGFSDTDEDISNVMVALNKAQVKNEQVIGSVKAGTGEMIKILNSESDSNANIESQQKLQAELEQTEQQARETDEVLSNINQNSALSSDTSTDIRTIGIASESDQVEVLRQKIAEVTTAVDTKTHAFQEEEQVVIGTVQREISSLEALEGQIQSIINEIKLLDDIKININLDGSQIDDSFVTLLDNIKTKADGLPVDTLSNLANALSGLKLTAKTAENLELVSVALSEFKESLNGISVEGNDFLRLIGDITSRAGALKDLADVLKSTTKKIKEASKETEKAKDKAEGKEHKDTSDDKKNKNYDAKKNLVAIEETKAAMQKLKHLSDSDIFSNAFEEASAKIKEANTDLNAGSISLTEYKKKVKEIQNELQKSQGVVKFVDPGDFENAKTVMGAYAREISEYQAKLKSISTSNDGKKEKITYQWIEEETGLVRNLTLTYDKLTGAIYETQKAHEQTEESNFSFLELLKQGWTNVLKYVTSFVGFYEIWGALKNGVTVIRELDTALTEMRKVSDESVKSLRNFQKVSFDIANTVGTTAVQIQNSTADFMRLGESLEQAAKSAEVANILLNVSEFENINEATDSLVSMSAAYDELDKIDIVDKLNIIGNNFAISTDGLATALKDSASALRTANNDMDEAVALATAANAVVQDPNKVGAGLRTIALRITGKSYVPEHIVICGC